MHRLTQVYPLVMLVTVSTTAIAIAQTPGAAPTTKDRVDQAIATVTLDPMKNADPDIKHVLDKVKDLGFKPIEKLSPQDARAQPTPADGVKALLKDAGKSAAPDASVTMKDVKYPGANGEFGARIYMPAGAPSGPLPVVLYFHGGGWVIAGLDAYDASPRAIAKGLKAIVVSADYSYAPEHKFPAAHDDAIAAYRWVLANAKEWGGDPAKIALVGESAGGNLAIDTAIAARDAKLQKPVAEVLVYPVAGVDTETASYKEDASAKPLNKDMMFWFFDKVLKSDADKNDPRLDIIGKADLKDLPPTTIINAQIDPLRSDGEMLSDKLKQAGVSTEQKTYAGMTHEFFGTGAVVAKAKDAEDYAVSRLKAAFASSAMAK